MIDEETLAQINGKYADSSDPWRLCHDDSARAQAHSKTCRQSRRLLRARERRGVRLSSGALERTGKGDR